MARRPKGDTLGVAIYFILSILAVALYVVGVALLAVLTAAFYAAPFAIGYVIFKTREVSSTPPELPKAADFELDQLSPDVELLLGNLLLQGRQHKAQHAIAEANGIRLTKGSNEKRFDTRSRLGRELNDSLEQIEGNISEIKRKVAETRNLVLALMPNWRGIYLNWCRLRSARLALGNAVAIGAMVGVAVYVYRSRPEISGLNYALLWNPLGTDIAAPLVGAVLATYLTFFIARLIHLRRLSNSLDFEFEAAWRRLERKWSSDIDPFSFFNARVPLDQRENDASQEWSATWPDVLGVRPDAEPAEIKKAYRELIKGYHSDKVASLGPKLRKLAEEESRCINAAYDDAKAARNFS